MEGERNCRLKKGFTLLELIIAMAIFVSVVTGLFVTFTACVFLNRSNSNLIIAANDAQYLLEEVKGLAFADIEGYSPLPFSNLDNESISFFVSDFTPKIKEVIVVVTWDERGANRDFTLSTRIVQ